MDSLRKKAEELLQLKNLELGEKLDDIKKVMHELQVYQIELELQNKELQDYSEKTKLLERKFYTLFNFSPISYFLFNNRGIIADTNLKAVELLALSKEQVINLPMISFIGDGRKDMFFTFIEDAFNSKTPTNEKFTLQLRNKNILMVEFVAIKIYNDHILAAAIDITEKEQRDIELKNALLEAKESDNLKSEFLNTISHEIRTPLNAIKGFSSMLSNKNLSENKRFEYTKKIEKGTSQLLKIVEDILLVSNKKNLEIENEITGISINRFLEEFKSEVCYKYTNENIEFSISYLDEEREIYIDKSKFKNILERIVENAFKFTKKGYVKLSCSVRKNSLIFSIEDSGFGISPQIETKLFKPFTQETASNEIQSGLGLGLSIAQTYAELLNGKIEYQANPDGGSIFTLNLPFFDKLEKEKQSLISAKDSIANKKESDNSTKKTILIAEDEQLNFELLEELLSEFDVNILHAKNGKIAVELFKQNKVDIILMDFKMPVMDGLTATKLIRATKKETTIVAITAYSELQTDKEITQYFDNFLLKPIDIAETLDTISKLLER